jgi:hypothetical protein
LFVGAVKGIKGSSDAAASGGGSAAGSIAPPEAEPPAVCWKLQFHCYDGDQDKDFKLPPDPATLLAGQIQPLLMVNLEPSLWVSLRATVAKTRSLALRTR